MIFTSRCSLRDRMVYPSKNYVIKHLILTGGRGCNNSILKRISEVIDTFLIPRLSTPTSFDISSH